MNPVKDAPPTQAVFALLDEVVDIPSGERDKILGSHDPAVAAEVRAMLEAAPGDSFLTPAAPPVERDG